MRNLAQRLIALEATGKNSGETRVSVAFAVPEKLRPTLSMLVGNAGYRTLLARALTLATAEHPGLRAVTVNVDGSLAGWEKLPAHVGPDKILEGSVVLIAQLFGLLVAFIGENLTVRLVGGVWPKLPLNDWNLGEGDTNEKAN
jgi:hypothetical protein